MINKKEGLDLTDNKNKEKKPDPTTVTKKEGIDLMKTTIYKEINNKEVLDLTVDIKKEVKKKIYTFDLSNELTNGIKKNSSLLKQFTDFATRKSRSTLLLYILHSVPIHEHLLLANTVSHNQTHALDQLLISQARDLLKTCMMRRIKSKVEASLLPKIEYVLKPLLRDLQRKWCRLFLESDGTASSRQDVTFFVTSYLLRLADRVLISLLVRFLH